MKASVVLPVYNKAPFLRECLDSIRAQDFREFELIAVDDCSTDESLAILQGIDDMRLKIIRSERNLGPAGAMQLGVDTSIGEYIIRVDADDVCLAGRFHKQVRFMDTRTEVGLSGGAISLLHRPDAIRSRPLVHEACKVELLFGVAVHQPTSIFRRHVLLQSGIRFATDMPRWGEDWLVQLRLSEATRLANLAEPLTLYRIGPQNSKAGRDRKADLTFLLRHSFAHFGVPLPDEELPQAFAVLKEFDRPLSHEDVAAFKRWLGRLREEAARTGRFDERALNARLDQAWDELCYHMPRFGRGMMLAYLLKDHRPSLAKARYAISSLIRGNRYANDDPE
ncbi:MAG: glycosyltransferase [Flavobacteriales bacterium]|nr:glycosyltransferase [Flavobacteriales bacterium]